jgi:hypothetical protein
MIRQPLVPRVIQNTVALIYHELDGQPTPAGTGFFISYRSPVNPEAGPNYHFLITARHLIFDKNGTRQRAWARVNRKDKGTELVPVGNDRIYVPADPTIDLVVLPGVYVEAPVDLLYLQADEFVATREDLQPPRFGVGADVLYSGLFNPHIGETRNRPITRFGRMALIPDDPVFWEEQYVRVLLAEIASYPGSSGSPVFIFLGHTDQRGLPVPRLLGVLKGSFTQKLPGEFPEAEAKFLVNSVVGVAAIVPAFLLDDFIRQQVIPEVEQDETEPKP